MQSLIEVNEEDLYTLKINCKEKRTVGKANKGINVKNNRFKKLKLKKRKEKKGKPHITAKAQHKGRGL